MNHYAWTYVAGEGRNTKVGLYHSSTTGHLMIYAGKKIVTIDFKVLDTKEYTFFIDDELCKIKLERRNDEMFYFFEIDKKADTPLNRARWARERKYMRQMLISFGVIGVLVTAVVIWARMDTRGNEAEELLAQRGLETFGRIQIDTSKPSGAISFQFIDKDKTRSGKLNQKKLENTDSKNKLPLETGDEFLVRYVPSRPTISRIYLNQPSERQIELYKLRTFAKHSKVNSGSIDGLAQCMVEVAYELEGLNGLATFYFQNTSPKVNPRHNSEVYNKFINSPQFIGAIKKRCPSE